MEKLDAYCLRHEEERFIEILKKSGLFYVCTFGDNYASINVSRDEATHLAVGRIGTVVSGRGYTKSYLIIPQVDKNEKDKKAVEVARSRLVKIAEEFKP